MAKVGIVMGSDSDMPVMSKAAAMLEKLGVDYEMTIISAHREPDGRQRFPVLYRTDADRYPGGNRGNQRRSQCGDSRSKDSRNI